MKLEFRNQRLFLFYILGLIILLGSSTLPQGHVESNNSDSSISRAINAPTIETNSDEWIAFKGLDNNIWLIYPDGSGKRQITSNAGEAGSYSRIKWSPDGKLLAYVFHNQKKNSYQLMIFELNGEKERIIYGQSYFGIDWGYDWSPDSKAIAYLVGGEITLIYLSDQDNENYANSYLGNEIQWKNDSNYEIEWSPSGKEIFLGCSSAIRCAGYLYFIETGEDQVLADFLQCKWSPKGTQLFCIIPKESNGFISENVLGFLDINSGNMSEIESTRTFYPTSYTSILWSPDGKNIGESSYFMDVVGGPTSFLLNPDMLVQTDLGETTLLDWSPDSQRLLGKDINQRISIIDIISKNKTYLTDGVEAVWQPKPYSRINANVESLPPIETLNVKPGDNKGDVRLEWTAPVVNNKNSGQYYYDIRSSESPLEEKNWEIGMKYQNKVSVSPELNSIIWNNQPLAQVRFYGIRIVDQKGNPVSPISNIVSFIDSGFRANVNGYSFRNGPWDDPDTPEKKDVTGWSENSENDFSYDDICNMLGDPNLCSKVTFRPWVDLIKNEMYSLQGGGQCAGMSSTSAYFSYLDKNPLLPSPESSVYQGVKLNDVRKVIALESFKQFTSPTFDWITTQLGTSTTKDTISTIGLAFIKKDPIILSMYPANKYPHAVTPVAMTGYGDGKFILWIYDNNTPLKRFGVLIDAINDTWKYGDWFGVPGTHSLFPIPVSLFKQKQNIPKRTIAVLNNIYRDISSIKSFLYTNNMGKRFGFDSNGQFINEIPNSQVITPLLATEQNVSLIYSLPADQDYMVDFSSTSLEGTQTSDFTQIGSNFYLSIIANSSQPLTNDHISIKKDGTEVFYRSGSDKEVNISLGLTKENKNYDYELSSLNIDAGKAISLFEKGEDHLFIVSGAQSNSGSYQIKIKQPNISGERTFSASNISLAEGDTHSYVLDQWGLDGRMTLLIDHGSDGSIDKEIKLKNESPNPLSIWWIAGGGITILCCSTVVIGLIVFLFLYRRKRISAK